MNSSQFSMDHLTNATQQKILESAIKIFSQKGFSASTTKEIAKEANVSEATIFRYFETKKDLLFSLISPAMVKSITDLFFDINGKNDEEIFKNFLMKNSEAIQNNKDLFRIILFEALFYPEIKEKIFNDVISKKAQLLEKYFEKQQELGNTKDISPKTSVRVLIGMLVGYSLWKYGFGEFVAEEKEEEEIINDMVAIFLNGVKK